MYHPTDSTQTLLFIILILYWLGMASTAQLMRIVMRGEQWTFGAKACASAIVVVWPAYALVTMLRSIFWEPLR